jgi:hypothetical protein
VVIAGDGDVCHWCHAWQRPGPWRASWVSLGTFAMLDDEADWRCVPFCANRLPVVYHFSPFPPPL